MHMNVLGRREPWMLVNRVLILDQISAVCLCRVLCESSLRADGLEKLDRVFR